MSVDLISDQFFETVNDCRRIYVDQATEVALSSSTLSADHQNEFLDEIELRFNRLLIKIFAEVAWSDFCLLYTSPSPRDATLSRMPSSA